MVWDVALLRTARVGTLNGAGARLAVVARQISDFPITKMAFSPFEKQVRSLFGGHLGQPRAVAMVVVVVVVMMVVVATPKRFEDD